ncbi:MAG: TerL protein [Betaproteobacteria bacterium]|nr:TerL protein [Betaproteobacteria bacterium]
MIDYNNPDYTEILKQRCELLAKLRGDKKLLIAYKIHYKSNPWDFINDWGMTFEPRNIEKGLPSVIPFVLFPRQIDFLKWIHAKWQNGDRGLAEKSRDFGLTWLCGSYAASMCIFNNGFTTGFGSRKEALVDKKGDPKCIFEKIRFFIDYLPKEFRPKMYDEKQHATFMKITLGDSTITGEAGYDIGRGARMSIYFVDEAAFIERQESVDAALSQTTNCQIDVSTPNGNGNLFFKKRHKGNIDVFTAHWRDDPRKNDLWYAKQKKEQDEVTVAQEIDIDYNASVENIFIPAKWVQACIDAHIKLGFQPTGADVVSFDPADTGDARAIGHRKGVVTLEAKSRKDGDITDAMPWAFELAENVKADVFVYDADGMGAPSMKLYLNRAADGKKMNIIPYHGGAKIYRPGEKYKDDKLNKDKFVNRRAQSWMNVRDRAEKTYLAVNGEYHNPDELISISSKCSEVTALCAELSGPLRIYNNAGKIGVESKERMKSRGVDSPNLADQFIYSYDPESVPSMKENRVTHIPKAVRGFKRLR